MNSDKVTLPNVSNSAFIAHSAVLVGDMLIKSDASIWFGCVIKSCHNNFIQISEGSNIQDGSVLYTDITKKPEGDAKEANTNLYIGKNVTVGHSCVLCSCTIEDNVFIGMKSVITKGAKVNQYSMLGASSLLTENQEIPTGELWMGNPAKFVRKMSQNDFDSILVSAQNYRLLAKEYKRH